MTYRWFTPLILIPVVLAITGCSLFGVLRGDPYPRWGDVDRIYRLGSPKKMVAWGLSASDQGSVYEVLLVLTEVMTDPRFSSAEQQQAADGAFTVLNRALGNEPPISAPSGTPRTPIWRSSMYLLVLNRAAKTPDWEKHPSVQDLYKRLEPVDLNSIVYSYWRRKPAEYDNGWMSEEMWQWNEVIRNSIDLGDVRLRGEVRVGE